MKIQELKGRLTLKDGRLTLKQDTLTADFDKLLDTFFGGKSLVISGATSERVQGDHCQRQGAVPFLQRFADERDLLARWGGQGSGAVQLRFQEGRR